MEFVACFLGGILLVACGLALFWLRPPQWDTDGEFVEPNRIAVRRWSLIQLWTRAANNSLIIVIGFMIIATAFIPHGPQDGDSRRTWMGVWSTILLLLMVCILFAILDAMSSVAGYKRALPEVARKSFANMESGQRAMEMPDCEK